MSGAREHNDSRSWQIDPFGRHEQRLWDGERWTERVRDGNVAGIDPPGIEPAPLGVTESIPAPPITDSPQPLAYRPLNLPRILLAAVVVIGLILVLIIVGIATA